MEHKMIVEIFGKEQCPFCDKAKGLAERMGHDYTYMQLGLDFEFPEFMEKFPTARTFPQIIVGFEKVGGYEQMMEYIDNTGYNGTGHSIS